MSTAKSSKASSLDLSRDLFRLQAVRARKTSACKLPPTNAPLPSLHLPRHEKNNRHLFFAGGSAGAKLRVFILDPSLVRLGREIPTANPPKFTEGPFLHEHAGIYHLTYSHGGWRDASYSVHHATSNSPLGPWTYRGCILKSDARHKGPGHHSIVRKPGTDQWLIIYHRWNHREGNGPYHGSRSIAIDRLEHGKNGTILPVVMTDDGIIKM